MLNGFWQSERGFTLIEVMITIIVMGVLAAIAMSSWFGVVESRRVDSAANRVAADMRQAHSSATNRLTPRSVSLIAGSSEYSMTGAPFLDLDDDPDRDLVTVGTTATMAFCPDGSVEIPPSSPPCPNGSRAPESAPSVTITIASADGAPTRTIEVWAATSRVRVNG